MSVLETPSDFNFGPNIKRLEELARASLDQVASGSIPVIDEERPLPSVIEAAISAGGAPERPDDPFVWPVNDGLIITAWPLYTRRGAITVVKVHFPEGAVFPVHKHDQTEVILVYEGQLRYESSDTERTVDVGGCVRVPQEKPHKVYALAESWAIVSTIPDSPGLPARPCLHEQCVKDG